MVVVMMVVMIMMMMEEMRNDMITVQLCFCSLFYFVVCCQLSTPVRQSAD